MRLPTLLTNWLDELAAALAAWRGWRRKKASIIARREGARVVLRREGDAAAPPVAILEAGEKAPADLTKIAGGRSIDFEIPPAALVRRRLTVPSQARDVLPGIVRNQMERLSPWPLAAALYGFDAPTGVGDGKNLEVRILIAAKKTADALLEEAETFGLRPDRLVARRDGDTSDSYCTLWSRVGAADSRRASAPRAIAAALSGIVLLSALVTGWAALSTAGLYAERDELATRADTLRRHDRGSGGKEAAALKDPAQRAWAMKETAPVSVFVLEALTKALPDSAYVTELTFARGVLRVTGLASDPPSLIAALEHSGEFSGVHFFAATTRDADSGLYRFNIEAQTAPRLTLAGD
jgi:general secretion pathway protein L